jgi:DNA-binding MarR family transcriptional regulator
MNKHLTSSRPEDGFEVLERRITYRFALIASQLGSALAPLHMDRHGLSIAAWRVLAVIARHEPISATELAARTSNDPFRVSRALVTLTEKKLISRKPDPTDRRRASLRLTASGRAAHQEIAAALARIEGTVLSALSSREQVVLFGLLDKIDSKVAEVLPLIMPADR